MIKIGLTGILGSGKTTVAALLKKRGLEIIDLDALAKDSLNRKETQDDIRRAFGEEYVIDGRVDIKKLRAAAFGRNDSLRTLERIIHPRVHEEVARRVAALEKKGRAVVVFDHPLLFETGFDSQVDRTVVVTADMEVIKERLKRRGMEVDDMERRLLFQMPLEEKTRKADYVIDNSGSEDGLGRQIDSLMEEITKWR